jgi:Ca2+-transporting ATPase
MDWCVRIDMEWHSLSAEETLTQLKTSRNGLSDEQAKERLERHGPNTIVIKKRISPVKIFTEQFKNLLVILLLVAAVISFAISFISPEEGDYIDAILIFAIVMANAFFGFVQEYKAEKTIEELTRMSAPRATVIRNGKEKEVGSEGVVPGDILAIKEGDKVAADARMIESFSLYSDQSMLTGESIPISKWVKKVDGRTPLAERSNMVFMDTVITRGRGMAVVVETGLKTEVGMIAKEIAEAPDKVTQFQVEIQDVGKKVSVVTLVILLIIAATEFFLRTGDILFIFIAAVALGVAAIPEGLPAVVTLALSIATNRMLKQKSLMRRLSTVQDLGAVNVICTDKTGTLTENVMTVTRICITAKCFNVSGRGLDTKGAFTSEDGDAKELDLLFKCAVLCNDAKREGDAFKGDPTETAVLIPAYKAGLKADKIRKEYRRVSEIPFSAERKMMTTINRDGGATYSFVKGAPETILSRCSRIKEGNKVRKLTAKDRKSIMEHNDGMASDALRVLAFAYKKDPKSYAEKDAENGLVFLGLMGMIDPPRIGVKEAVADCRRAGIRVIMVTGDNRYTAEAIGRKLDFEGKVMTGDELDGLSPEQLLKAVEKFDIFARTSPHHKIMLLEALQKNGHVVCMTGDGVNDAGAIKHSDVGIAMGIRGTEVTKQASDMIILDDNFITIRNAISEGRGTFDNIRKFVVYLLGANISEVLVVFFATVSALGISPKIPIQLLWINLLTDGMPALAIGVDPPPEDVMERRPRKKEERMINGDTFYFLVSIGLAATLAIISLYAYTMSFGSTVKAYTMLFTSFVVLEMITVYLVRWRYKSASLSNNWLHMAVAASLILQLVILYTPFNALFMIEPLSLDDWLLIGLNQIGYLVLVMAALAVEPFILRTRKK